MVGQALDLLGHPISSERLEGLDDAGMQRPPPLQQEAAVGHLVGESVLEGVLMVGKQPGFVEELAGLQMRQRAPQGRLR